MHDVANRSIRPSKLLAGYWYMHPDHQNGEPFLVIENNRTYPLITGVEGRECSFYSSYYRRGGCRAIIGVMDDAFVKFVIDKFNEITSERRDEQIKNYPSMAPDSDVLIELRYCEDRPTKVEFVKYDWDRENRIVTRQEPIYAQNVLDARKQHPNTEVFECTLCEEDPGTMSFACPYCGNMHIHGVGADGPRVSHCFVNINPYVVVQKGE